MWDCLRTSHKGKSQVKDSKLDMLITQYEAFIIKKSKIIQEMHTRLIAITNELYYLGEVIRPSKQVRKMYEVLSKS